MAHWVIGAIGALAHWRIGALGHTPNPNPNPIQVATTFAETQNSVLIESKSMQARLGRTNYVTPTNYLELVKGYCKLLKEKRATVGDQAAKLRNGLTKLSDTATQVSEMSVELEQKKKVVARRRPTARRCSSPSCRRSAWWTSSRRR